MQYLSYNRNGTKSKKIIIFGNKTYAGLVYEYFTHDSEYEVAAFTIDRDYITDKFYLGLPIVPFDEVESRYPPDQYEMHVALAYGEINRLRARVCKRVKAKGYALASYVSSRAFVWHNVKLGENCFIFEDNTVQPFVEIGNHVILWSGNHIGHHSVISDNCFISSHVAIAGFCKIGANCFLGVNSSVGDQLTIGAECWIGHGTVISKDVPDSQLVKAQQSDVVPLNVDSLIQYLSKRSI